jgi:pimeloyl-ACP methyl ester carboxylesterase
MRYALLILSALLIPAAYGSDLAKEQRWADQIVDSLIDGEAEWLEAGDVRFLAIHQEADEPGGRAALVLHGIGVHPNWPQVVYPLRTGLPAEGWSTLSLQMPVLPNEAQDADYAPLFDEVSPRIEAGVAFLKEQGAQRVVVVAHSLGAAMAARHLATHPGEIAALVAVGMSGARPDPRMDNVASLEQIRIPVLDVYGQHDLAQVLESGAERAAAAARAGNPGFTQVQIPEADHFFDGHSQTLLEVVVDWLDAQVPPAP